MMALYENVAIHPLLEISLFTIFHASPSYSWWD